MNFVTTQIRRLFDAVFAVAFVLAFLQLPVFFELYHHRLDEKRVTIENLLTTMRASPTPDATTIARTEAELPALRARLDLLAQGGFGRLRAAFDLDMDVAKRALGMMQPGLRFDLDSLGFGAIGLLLGLMSSAILAAIARLFLPRQHAGYAR
ncbi:MAG: hypothetical protein J0H39_09180 [Alphaproteobacteria bacterium]|nr:hypothetical protein [Alphaproteobacteria bacterium]MBN9496917.1 hypothetical protein [Alphaproteobacteria bacterium]